MPGHPETWVHVGNDPHYCVTLHDIELPEELRKERPNADEQGTPETVPLIVEGDATLRLDETIQWKLFTANKGLEAKSFSAILDTWNRKGMKFSEGKANFITGDNLSAELPVLPLDLTFGGAVHCVKQELIWKGGNGVAPGTAVLELVALSPFAIPDGISYETHPQFVVHLVTTKGDKVNPFVQNGGGRNGGRPCVTLFMQYPGTRVFIEKARTKRLESLNIPNPYVSAWKWKR
jgi:hypothetical protein